ncbi:hypothetical protein HQ520_18070 [bacterium]|nr:hypothetical protein [bacterium]
MRRRIQSILVTVVLLTVLGCEPSMLELKVTGFETREEMAFIRASVHNPGPEAIWVCRAVDSPNGVVSETAVNPEDGTWIVEVRTARTPSDVLLESPFWGLYERVKAGQDMALEVRAPLPPANRPAFEPASATQPGRPGQVDRLILRVGYYGEELTNLSKSYLLGDPAEGKLKVNFLVLDLLTEDLLETTISIQPLDYATSRKGN